jgi:hypothetical protein
MKKQVTTIIEKRKVCQMVKGQRQNTRKYKPLLILNGPWEDNSMDFVLRLPEMQRFNSAFVVVDRFSNTANFLAYKTTNDASNVADLIFTEILKLHGLPKTIASDC